MNSNSPVHQHALAPETCLHNAYVIQEILGEGGFGITYNGYRKCNGIHVAIKEYFPHQIALRTEQEGVLLMQPFPEKYAETFEKGRQRFLDEANTLRKLQHLENIVAIYDSFEENGTAYIVMEYIEGPTLGQFVQENGAFSFPELLQLMAPVMHALSQVHKQGLIHRDISPDNLLLGMDNKLHLIDFGAVAHDSKDNTQNTVILKAGYAPPEQYISNGKIGAWVDVYALCATMYFALTAKPPQEAMLRLNSEDSESLPYLENLLPKQRAALEKGLQLRSANRFHDMEELYEAFTDKEEDEDTRTRWGSELTRREMRRLAGAYRPRSVHRLLAVGMIFVVLTVGAVMLLRMPERRADGDVGNGDTVPTASASVTPTPAPKQNIATTEPVLLRMVDVSNLKVKKAKKAIRELDASIQIKTVSKYHDTVASGCIITQSVAPGTVFSSGQISSIRLTVSKGRREQEGAAATPAVSTASPNGGTDTKDKGDYDVKSNNDYTTIPLE